jgi:hypothetical protein
MSRAGIGHGRRGSTVKLRRGTNGGVDGPVDGELGNGERERERGRARGGREGRGSAFYRESGGEGESPWGEGGRSTINGAIMERTWGRERERDGRRFPAREGDGRGCGRRGGARSGTARLGARHGDVRARHGGVGRDAVAAAREGEGGRG